MLAQPRAKQIEAGTALMRGPSARAPQSSGEPDVLGARALRTLPLFEGDCLSFAQARELRSVYRRLMEEVFGAVRCRDEAEPLVRDQPFDRTVRGCHFDLSSVRCDSSFTDPTLRSFVVAGRRRGRKNHSRAFLRAIGEPPQSVSEARRASATACRTRPRAPPSARPSGLRATPVSETTNAALRVAA